MNVWSGLVYDACISKHGSALLATWGFCRAHVPCSVTAVGPLSERLVPEAKRFAIAWGPDPHFVMVTHKMTKNALQCQLPRSATALARSLGIGHSAGPFMAQGLERAWMSPIATSMRQQASQPRQQPSTWQPLLACSPGTVRTGERVLEDV